MRVCEDSRRPARRVLREQEGNRVDPPMPGSRRHAVDHQPLAWGRVHDDGLALTLSEHRDMKYVGVRKVGQRHGAAEI